MESSVQSDKGIGIWHSLYTLPDRYCAYCWCATNPTLSGISTLSQEEVSTLCSLSIRLTMVLGICALLIYSNRRYCTYFWCVPLQHFYVFLVFARRGFQLFGVSVQTDKGIGIWHSLYTLPEDTVPTSGVHLSITFRYFYF